MFTPPDQMASVPLYSFFRAFRTHTMFTNLAWASLSASIYLLVVVRLACPANAEHHAKTRRPTTPFVLPA